METLYQSDAVVQLIPTIQCEINIGKPVILLRLRGCNCKCDWCDSKYTWSNSEHKLTNEDVKAVIQISKDFPNIKRLLITGGEPLLYQHQEEFFDILNIKEFPFIEIETNGSLLTETDSFIDEIVSNHLTLNISPKLNVNFYKNQKDYDSFKVRFKNVLDRLFCLYKWSVIVKLKFVYEKNTDFDIKYINKFIEETDAVKSVGMDSIYIMSNTSIEILNKLKNGELESVYPKLIENDIETIKTCIEYGYSFSPRTHLMLFRDKNEMGSIL